MYIANNISIRTPVVSPKKVNDNDLSTDKYIETEKQNKRSLEPKFQDLLDEEKYINKSIGKKEK